MNAASGLIFLGWEFLESLALAHRYCRGEPSTLCPSIWLVVHQATDIGLLKTPIRQMPGVTTGTVPRGQERVQRLHSFSIKDARGGAIRSGM